MIFGEGCFKQIDEIYQEHKEKNLFNVLENYLENIINNFSV